MQLYVLVVIYSSPWAPCLQGGPVKDKGRLYRRLVDRNESKLFQIVLLSEKGKGMYVVFPLSLWSLKH